MHEVTKDLGDWWELERVGERAARERRAQRVRPVAHRGQA